MNLNIFSPVKRVKKRGKAKDAFDKLIDVIEKFAPREHLSEREAYYYNYRMIDQYKRPLLSLLETASQLSKVQSDRDTHDRELFLKLKSFYDIKDTLSMEEAIADVGLIRRFRDLLIYFYDRKDLSNDDIRDWLKTQ